MKITKSQLKQIIKEETGKTLIEAAGEQKYCCLDGVPFKLVDQGTKYLMIGCSETSCNMLGSMPKEEFQAKLESGEFKPAQMESALREESGSGLESMWQSIAKLMQSQGLALSNPHQWLRAGLESGVVTRHASPSDTDILGSR